MKKSLLIGALLALPFTASAEGLSYNYVQLDWIASSDVEIEGPGFEADGDGEGFALEGVFSFTDTFFVEASYADSEVDIDGGPTVEGDTITLGVGAHTNQFTGAVDLFGVVSYIDVEDDDGFGLEIGARTMVKPAIEAFISYAIADFDEGDFDGFSIGGLYTFMPQWSVGLEYIS
ncbi:MAG: hypothetical protein R3352_11655, partial [Salinisphaeraceae bacterium]|nr:hypothetical protein [Salinisphaeraceae bacterium]